VLNDQGQPAVIIFPRLGKLYTSQAFSPLQILIFTLFTRGVIFLFGCAILFSKKHSCKIA